MAKKRSWLTTIILILTIMVPMVSTLTYTTRVNAATAPTLGTAQSYAVLGGSTVTNTGPTVVNGDLGLSPGSSVTGFPPGVLNGTLHIADAGAIQAQIDTTNAYNNLAGQASNANLSGQDLGGMTLTTGVYTFSSSAQLTGTLTLDAQGDANAVFIFQIGSTLTTASSSVVSLTNGASPCKVFWQVGSSATIGTTTTFVGSILALTSITLNTGATVSGRALARNGAVTMDSNVFTFPLCGVPHLSLTKTVSPLSYNQVGEVLTYTLVAINDGSGTLTNVSISDPALIITGSTPAQPATLAPGDRLTVTGTHTVTQSDLDSGSFSNTATASGTSPTGATVSAIASITVSRCPPASLWAVEYRYGPPAPGYKFLPNNIFKSWLQVRWVNDGPGIANNVKASITNAPVNVTVVDGQVNLGTIPAGGTAWSTDTFTLLVDMKNPQNPQLGIVWQVEYDDVCGNHHVITGVPKFKGEPARWQ